MHWFPMPMPSRHAERRDLEQCRRLLQGGSRSFYAASFLLPAAIRAPACALYAFCREADDAIDLHDDPERGLAELQERLAAIYRGVPRPVPADRAFACVVERFDIPIELPHALLEGFEWDTRKRRHETIDDVLAYSARVAGSVGAMMTLVMHSRSGNALARACDLGVAMQLSNIARDVGEDARAGRLYLPLAWFHQHAMDPGLFLCAPRFDERVSDMVERLLAIAEQLYQRADAGIGLLPATCRPGIRAARHLYAAIGHEVLSRQYDSITSRAVVGPAQKARLLAHAVTSRRGRASDRDLPPLPQTRFLVEAVTRRAEPSTHRRRHDAENSRTAWVIDLFARLEAVDRSRRELAQ